MYTAIPSSKMCSTIRTIHGKVATRKMRSGLAREHGAHTNQFGLCKTTATHRLFGPDQPRICTRSLSLGYACAAYYRLRTNDHGI